MSFTSCRLVSWLSLPLAVILLFPIGASAAASAACATPISPSASAGSAVAQSAYNNWKSSYVTTSGAGGNLRVQRSAGDGYDSVSEGIAYGMLFAAYNNDKPTFDGLWAYEQSHLNGNGFMNWRISSDGSTSGYNGATDADEDMATALIAANSRWGGYKPAAVKQINLIRQFEVENGSYVLKPGDAWGGSDLLNPSYLAPSYYDVFANVSGDSSWSNVKAASYRVLNAIHANTDSRDTGLIPDWSSSNGAATNGMSHDYGYDASRSPLRLAVTSLWSCDANANDLLAPFNATFKSKDLTSLASNYRLDGSAVDHNDSTPLVAAAAAGAITSSDAAYRSGAWNVVTANAGSSNGYYSDSMRLFSIMVASGVMVNPMTLPAGASTAPTQPSIPSLDSLTSSNVSATTGTSTTLNASITSATPRSNMLVDLELYDANGKRVAQQVYENQSLTTSAKNYGLTWTPNSAGTYTLKGGIFTAGWANNIIWNDNAAKLTVTSPAAPSPAPAPTSPPATTPPSSAPSSPSLSIWWPGSTRAVSGVQPFKAVVDGLDTARYSMYWQVDGGSLNLMNSVNDSAPHKESLVDLSGWSWSGNGTYTINFVAKDANGVVISQKSTVITITH